MRFLLKITTVFLFCALLLGCEDIILPEPENNPEAIFEDLWTRFHDEYAPFEERGVDWNAQYVKYRPLVNENTSKDELFNIFSSMLGSLNDGHVSLTAPGKKIFFSNKIRNYLIEDSLFRRDIIMQNYLEPGFTSDNEESYFYGKLKATNLGYIFFDHVGENFLKLDEFFKKLKESDGYIIDLRHNQGGDFTYAFSAFRQMTKEREYIFRSKTKNGTGEMDYTPWYSWYLEPEGEYMGKPIVVLTDRYTISAGERAVMAFGKLPQVTIIGDTTNGAHGTMIGRELANGWFYSLVPQKVELFDGKSYEGIGLAPDIYIKNNLGEVSAGKDNTLERAIEELK